MYQEIVLWQTFCIVWNVNCKSPPKHIKVNVRKLLKWSLYSFSPQKNNLLKINDDNLLMICWLLTGCWDQLTGTRVACSAVGTHGGADCSEAREDQGAGWPAAAAQLWVTRVWMCLCDQTSVHVHLPHILTFHFFRWLRWTERKLRQWNRSSRVSKVKLTGLYLVNYLPSTAGLRFPTYSTSFFRGHATILHKFSMKVSFHDPDIRHSQG